MFISLSVKEKQLKITKVQLELMLDTGREVKVDSAGTAAPVLSPAGQHRTEW
jgi:hypothetical protein